MPEANHLRWRVLSFPTHDPVVFSKSQKRSDYLPLPFKIKLTTVKFYASTDRCVCCDVPYDGFARYPFCDRCFSGRCRRCVSRVRESILSPFHLIGRPRGPQMACGWGCGACLTEHQMRTHFTICPKRPAISDHVRRASPHRAAGSGQTNKRLRRSKAKRAPPPGRRMPCASQPLPGVSHSTEACAFGKWPTPAVCFGPPSELTVLGTAIRPALF